MVKRQLVAGVLVGAGALSSIGGWSVNLATSALPSATATSDSWSTFHQSPGLNGVSPDPTISASNASGLGIHWMAQTGAPVASSPVFTYDATIGANLVVVANTSGSLEGLNAKTGAIVWSDNFGVPFYATPTERNGYLWLGTFVSGRMYKVNTQNGAVACSVATGTGSDLSSPVIATPPGGSSTVYVGVEDNGVVSSPVMAIDDATCKVDWSVVPWIHAPISGSWNPTSFGVDANGVPLVLAGSANPDSTMYALNANTGATVWSSQTIAPTYNDVGSGGVVSPPGNNGFADGVVYYEGESGILFALNLTTGATLWTFNFRNATTPSAQKGGRSTVALSGNTLVVGTGTGVMAVNATTGAEIWDSAKTVAPGTEVVSSPLITGPVGSQVVAYGDLSGVFHVLSLATGAQLYSYQTHGYILSSPAEEAGQIDIASSDGFTYSFALGGATSLTYPTTSITSPTNGSSLSNPGSVGSPGSLTVSGLVIAPDPSPQALVAVEENGGKGDWWNGTTGQWQPGMTWNSIATTAGSVSNTWAMNLPVPTGGGSYEVYARGQDSNGEVDPSGVTSSFSVQSVQGGPTVTSLSPNVAPSNAVKLSGSGFGAAETVAFSLSGTILAETTTTATGTFADVAVKIPPRYPYGQIGIVAQGQSSGDTAVATLVVNSSWPSLGGDQMRSGNLPSDTVFNVQEVPDKIYRLSPNLVFDSSSAVTSSASVAGLVAYFGNQAGMVDAINTVTGALAWQVQTGGAVDSTPAVDAANNLVLVGSSDDKVYGINAQSGAVEWSFSTGGAVSSSPTYGYGIAYVTSQDGYLYAIDESTGALVWRGQLGGASSSSPALDEATQQVVVGDTSGRLSAFSITSPHLGTPQWTLQLTGAINGAPSISGGQVFVGDVGGSEVAVNLSNGTTVWSTPLGGIPSATAAVSGAKLYVGSSNGNLYELSLSSGAIGWTAVTSGAVTGVASTIGLVFCESANGTVSGFRGSGENVWYSQTQGALTGTPAISDNAVIVGSADAGLYVYTPYGLPMT